MTANWRIFNEQTTIFHLQRPKHERVQYRSLSFGFARVARKELAKIIIEPLDVVLAITGACTRCQQTITLHIAHQRMQEDSPPAQ